MSNYEQLVKALRGKFFAYDVTGNHNSAQLYKDAADAIEDLQAQLPKRGEWVGVNPMVDSVQCSVCGGQLFSAELETPYCPYCGAKMEVQA